MRISSLAIGLLLVAFAVPAFAQETTRADFQEYCELTQGRWIGDVTWVTDWPGFGKKGDKVTCYLEATVVEDGNVITTRFFGGAGSGTGITFYDAGAKQIKIVWGNSAGAMSQAVVSKNKGQWVTKGVGSLADGRRTAFTNTLIVSDDEKTHTYKGTGTVGDEKTDDQCDIWRRVDE